MKEFLICRSPKRKNDYTLVAVDRIENVRKDLIRIPNTTNELQRPLFYFMAPNWESAYEVFSSIYEKNLRKRLNTRLTWDEARALAGLENNDVQEKEARSQP